MAAPRIRMARTSALRVDTQQSHDTPRRLLLIALLLLHSHDNADKIRLYGRYRSNATAFFEGCVDGAIQPYPNRFQDLLNALLPSSTVAHLYVGVWAAQEPTHYVSLMKGEDNLWRLRHRKIRQAPRPLGRDGVLVTWGDITPLPDIACAYPPKLERVFTGGIACRDFIAETEAVFEVRRQLTHCAMTCELFGSLHRDEVVTWHEPGRVVLRANRPEGHGYARPYGFQVVTVRPYAKTRTIKNRVSVRACTSDTGLYATQSPRCILPSVKGVTEYKRTAENKGERLLLSELLLSRLMPFVGITRLDGRVNLYGLSYDPLEKKSIVAEFMAGKTQRACEGLPVVEAPNPLTSRRTWTPNFALLTILRDLIYDLTPDEDARAERWYALTQVFRFFGVKDASNLAGYFGRRGLPLPNGSDEHIAQLVAAQAQHTKS